MWKSKKLKDVCDIQSGLWKGKKEPLTQAYVLRNTNFTASGLLDYSDVKLLEVEEKQLQKRVVLANDIILEKSGGGDKTPVGRVCIHEKDADLPFSLSNFTARLRVLDASELDARFLHRFLYFLYFSGKTEPMQRHSTGIRNLQLSQYKEITIPLPPLAEQQRIVAKLDAAFSEIDKAMALAEKNIENSERLYAYAIDKAFQEHESLAECLGNHGTINYGYTAKASFDKGTYKFLRITDIQDSQVDWDTVPYCEVEPKKISKMLLHDGDIVFARTGATTGKSFLLENPTDAVFASYLIRVSVDKANLLPRFVMHYFQSANYWQQVNDGISGAAQGGFNASKLAELRIPLIDKSLQKEIIERLDAVDRETRNLSTLFENKKNHLIALKAAILAKTLRASEEA